VLLYVTSHEIIFYAIMVKLKPVVIRLIYQMRMMYLWTEEGNSGSSKY